MTCCGLCGKDVGYYEYDNDYVAQSYCIVKIHEKLIYMCNQCMVCSGIYEEIHNSKYFKLKQNTNNNSRIMFFCCSCNKCKNRMNLNSFIFKILKRKEFCFCDECFDSLVGQDFVNTIIKNGFKNV